jgi:hypothetical protein
LVPSLGYGLAVPNGQIVITNPTDSLATLGAVENDVLYKINGTEVSLQNARMVIGTLSQQPIGYEYSLTVKRGEEEVEIASRIVGKQETKEHIFELDEDASEEAVALREKWLTNLD